MQEIETKALQIYQKNLAFLEKNHSQTFVKIQALNSATEAGQYTSKYDLEYIQSYFDVKQIGTSNYMYASESNEISAQLNAQVNSDRKSYCFDGFTMYDNFENITDQLIDSQKGLLGTYPLMSYYLKHLDEESLMKCINKFMFIGTGLGLHIPLIDKKILAKEYLIIEDDLELFNLSLFCTPYYEINSNAAITFCIAQNDKNFIDNFTLYLNEAWFENKYLKYSHFPAHSDHKIKLIQNVLAAQDFMVFPYRITQIKHLKPLEYINNGYNIVNLSHHLHNTPFSNKPTLVVAAGPSLDKNSLWLEQNHSKFLIIAVSSTLKYFYKRNIVPDLVVHLDGFDASMRLFEDFPAKEFLKDSFILFGSFAPTEVRELFDKEQCYFLEEDTNYLDGFSSRTGACVGSTSILHAIMFDAQEIYLLGLDYSLNSETGQSHSSEHVTKETQNLTQKDDLQTSIDGKSNLFPVKGNLDKVVYTNSLFHTSIQSLYQMIPYLKNSSQKIYNMNNGALIEDTISMPAQKVDVSKYSSIDKQSIHSEIQTMFETISRQNLSDDDIVSLKSRLTYVKNIKKYILKYQKKVSYKNSEKYLYDLLGIVSKILHTHGERETNNIVETYLSYFKYSVSIITDFLNTKSLKNSKLHMKNLDQKFVDELLVIAENYEKRYKEFIEEKKI